MLVTSIIWIILTEAEVLCHLGLNLLFHASILFIFMIHAEVYAARDGQDDHDKDCHYQLSGFGAPLHHVQLLFLLV